MLCSCHNSYEALNSCPEKLARRRPPQFSGSLFRNKQTKTQFGYKCDSEYSGLCIDANVNLSSDETDNAVFFNNEDYNLALTIPKFNPQGSYNSLYSQLVNYSSFFASDTMTICNDEILELLNLDGPVNILPGDYPISYHDSDNLFISLPMSPASLSVGAVVYFDFNNYPIFIDSFYHGFLGQSASPTAIIEHIADGYLEFRFPLDLNSTFNSVFLNELRGSSAFVIYNSFEINDPDILGILNISTPIRIPENTYFASESEDCISVIIPYHLIP